VQKIEKLLFEAQQIAEKELGLKNIYYNEQYIELFMADKLGHEYGSDTQGGDAIETDIDKPTEYKAINTRNKSPGSFQFHWLSKNKIEEYNRTENMYFCIRDGVTIKKIYRVPTSEVMPLVDKNATGSSDIGGHAGFSEKTFLKKFNPDTVYPKE